ncbi:MAG TPA: hypothetical protein VF395_21635 [Polyangiaceae bacterium]
MNRRSESSEHESVRRKMEEALREFGSPVVQVDHPDVVLARRDRTVSHLRALQAREVVRGQDARVWRRRLLVAALVLFPTGALAATWAVLRESQDFGARAETESKGAAVTGAHGGRVAIGSPYSGAPASLPVPSIPDVTGDAIATRDPAVTAPESASATSPGRVDSVRAMSRSAIPASAGMRAAGASPVGPSVASFKSFPEDGERAPESSTLGAENALMQAAMGAARAGDDSRAILRFSDFLARYPRSPLAENASVERLRAIGRLRTERSPSEGARALRAGAASGVVPLR